MLSFRYATASHPGLVRENNEDAGYAGSRLLVVADGVGGAPAGEVASASATHVVSAVAAITEDEPAAVLEQAVAFCHQHLHDGAEDLPSRQGMSTTLTAVLTDGVHVGLAHLGDSRGFVLHDGHLRQVTTDHTLGQLMIDSGQLTEAEAADLGFRAVIAKSLTADGTADPDVSQLDLNPGDRVLLASDGLTDLVGADRIGEAVAAPDLQSAIDQLVAAALAAGGRDNITCVLAELVETGVSDTDGQMLGAAGDPANLIDESAVTASVENGRRSAVLHRPGFATDRTWHDSRAV